MNFSIIIHKQLLCMRRDAVRNDFLLIIFTSFYSSSFWVLDVEVLFRMLVVVVVCAL